MESVWHQHLSRISVVLVAVALSGCVSAPDRDDETADLDAGIQAIPAIHVVQMQADLQKNGWAIWLWRNIGNGSERLELEFTHSAQVEPLTTESSPFWHGVYWINVAHDDDGRARHMSTRAPPWVQYQTTASLSDDPGIGRSDFSGGMSLGSITIQGVIAFSEEPLRIRVTSTLGSEGPTFALEPLAKGSNLSLQALPVGAVGGGTREPIASLEMPVAGFVANWLAMDVSGPALGPVKFDVELDFPDGEHRLRSFEELGVRSIDRCHPEDGGGDSALACRQAYLDNARLLDFSLSCQPHGDAQARVVHMEGSPAGRFVPVLFNVPFDYCPLVGADSSTPHPCRDMSTSELKGCPDD